MNEIEFFFFNGTGEFMTMTLLLITLLWIVFVAAVIFIWKKFR